MPLNDMRCRNAKPQNKSYKIFDGEGLYLEIRPNGSKYWRLKYRVHNIEKRLSLGPYPRVSLLQARQEKDKLKNQLRAGDDPSHVRVQEKQLAAFNYSQDLKSLALEWYNKNLAQWKPDYAQTVLHRLEKYVFPDLGDYPIRQITPLIILSCLQKIEVTAPEMARRIKQYLNLIFNFAKIIGRIEVNPCPGLEHALKKYKKHHYKAIDVDELPELLMALQEYKARLHRQTYLAVRFMLLTFVRTSELLSAEWTEINLEQAQWKIPGAKMKKDKDFIVPLSRQSIAILIELKKINPHSTLVFPGIYKPKKSMSEGTILVALKRMGFNGRMTGHGFRSLALGILKEKLRYSHEVADRQLAHVPKSSVDKAYDRAKFLDERIEMMQRYADYIDGEYLKALTKTLQIAA